MRHISSLAALAVMVATADAALTPVDDFGDNPGALDMFEYVPADLPAGRPLVVVLHGCTQTAAAMEAAGWNALADKHEFAVLYPQQRSANNGLTCFTWFEAGDITRGAGEAASIVQMIDSAAARHGIDKQRVYVTGISAGGAMVAVMLAAYPDRFRAGSVMAGVPYGCASDAASGSSCASSAPMKSPEQWGELARAAYAGFSGTYPRLQIWHGSQDYTVATGNATELVEQWTSLWETDQTADATDSIGKAMRTQYRAGSQLAVELYVVGGMGHAIAIGADDMGACPATLGAFFSDQQICSTLRAADFFGLLGGDGDPHGDGSDGDGSDSGSGSGSGSGEEDTGGCNATGNAGLALVALFALLRLRRSAGVVLR